MKNENPPSKDINVTTQKGLDLLKTKAKYYGHYAEHLKVFELIKEIEELKERQKNSGDELQRALLIEFDTRVLHAKH